MKIEMTADRITLRDAIVTMFLTDRNDHTVKEISAHLGWSEARVRRLITDDSGCGYELDGIVSSAEYRDSYSRDYPMYRTGKTHRVTVYGPTRKHLAGLLKTASVMVAKTAPGGCQITPTPGVHPS
jgi:hypothetical protein